MGKVAMARNTDPLPKGYRAEVNSALTRLQSPDKIEDTVEYANSLINRLRAMEHYYSLSAKTKASAREAVTQLCKAIGRLNETV
jgi:hypothetical protein